MDKDSGGKRPAVCHRTGGTMNILILRRTELDQPDWDHDDYRVEFDGKYIGRIMRIGGRWYWTIGIDFRKPGTAWQSGYGSTLEEVQGAFSAAWDDTIAALVPSRFERATTLPKSDP